MKLQEIAPPQPARGASQHSDVSNPFFEPWVLDNARRSLLRKHDRFLVIGEGRPIALPIVMDRRVPRWLPTVARVWDHNHCFDTTPLSRTPRSEDFEEFFTALADRGIDILRWRLLPQDTAFAARLGEFLGGSRLASEATKRYRRPLLVRDGTEPDGFLRHHLGKGRIKDLRRRRQRLSELGHIEFRTYGGQHDAALWCHDFIELEASGWKGPAGTGTAIACSAAERAFFEAMATDGAAMGRIVVHSLELEGRPIAMSVNLRSGARLWAYKAAYREDLGHLAPGIQVEVDGSRAFLDDPTLASFDSCTGAERGLMAELWPHRRPMAELLIAVHPRANPAVRAGGTAWRRYLALKRAVCTRFGPAAGSRPRLKTSAQGVSGR